VIAVPSSSVTQALNHATSPSRRVSGAIHSIFGALLELDIDAFAEAAVDAATTRAADVTTARPADLTHLRTAAPIGIRGPIWLSDGARRQTPSAVLASSAENEGVRVGRISDIYQNT
jgi:hypothetical protein